MSPKEKIRGNIYKELFTVEKRKNKKLAAISVGLFVFGLVTSTAYHSLSNIVNYRPMVSFNQKLENGMKNELSKLKMPKITLNQNVRFNEGTLENNIDLDHILNGNIFDNTKKDQFIPTDYIFGLNDVQI